MNEISRCLRSSKLLGSASL